jgi:tetratricopeptide (TPR) repeat protein
LGDFAGAIASYSQSIAINSTNFYPYYYRSTAELRQGDLDAALKDATRAIELNPADDTVYNDRGWVEFMSSNFPAAIADATRSIQLNTTNGKAYGTRGWAKYGSGDTTGAIEDCKTAISLFKSDSVETGYDQGLLAYIDGDYAKAIATWEDVLKNEPSLKSELQPWIDKAKAKLPAGP